MSWIGVLLVGIALADLARAVRPAPVLPASVGATGAILVGLLSGLTELPDVVALGAIAVAVVLWGWTVDRGLGGGPAWPPLVALGVAVLLAVVVSGYAGTAGGLLGVWLDSTAVPLLAALDADRALLLAGVLGVQLSTGNVLVRLVLAVTGTVNPTRHGLADDPETQLKGGRLLGPMERMLILGLGLAGELTAASIVVAAKGLLRFPELSSRREQVRIHQLTEYFLVGSFVSWLVALASLVLLAR